MPASLFYEEDRTSLYSEHGGRSWFIKEDHGDETGLLGYQGGKKACTNPRKKNLSCV